MTRKIDRSHVSKFDGSYFNIWKDRLALIFKAEKLWLLVDEKKSNKLHLQ